MRYYYILLCFLMVLSCKSVSSALDSKPASGVVEADTKTNNNYLEMSLDNEKTDEIETKNDELLVSKPDQFKGGKIAVVDSDIVQNDDLAVVDSDIVQNDDLAVVDSYKVQNDDLAVVDSDKVQNDDLAVVDSDKVQNDDLAVVDSDKVQNDDLAVVDSDIVQNDELAVVDSDKVENDELAVVDSDKVQSEFPTPILNNKLYEHVLSEGWVNEKPLSNDLSSEIVKKEDDTQAIVKKEDKQVYTVKKKKIHINDLKPKKITKEIVKYDFSDLPNRVTKKDEAPLAVFEYKKNLAIEPTSSIPFSDEIIQFNMITGESKKTDSTLSENIVADENSDVRIMLDGSGWIIKEINSSIVSPQSRVNYSDRTLFVCSAGGAGKAEIQFIRYDSEKKMFYEKLFNITINPRVVVENSNKKENKSENIKPVEKDYKRRLADNFYLDENYKDAAVSFESLYKNGNIDSELIYRLAESYKHLGNFVKAEEFYKKNVNDIGNAFFDDTVVAYIELLKKMEKYSQALDLLYNIALPNITGEKAREFLYLATGDLNFNEKKYGESARSYRNFLSLFESSVFSDKAIFYLAYSLEMLDKPQFKEARGLYNTILKKYPESSYTGLSRTRLLYLDRHFLKVN